VGHFELFSAVFVKFLQNHVLQLKRDRIIRFPQDQTHSSSFDKILPGDFAEKIPFLQKNQRRNGQKTELDGMVVEFR